MSAPGTSGRRRGVIAALLATAATALWGASRLTWVTVTSSDGLGEDRVIELAGGTWAAALTPLALALLAAVAASFAVRGWALRVLAVLVAVGAVAAAVPAVGLLTGSVDDATAARIAELPVRAEVTSLSVTTGPALLALAGAVAALAAAVQLWRTPQARAGLSSRYDSPAARREATARRDTADEPVTERTLWDALDAGEDPTVDAADDRSTDRGGEGGTDDSGTRRTGR
ncbi:TIGR02234 family membrane protein [Rhodococcus indonesiensis]|uniref:TIGR02234 family membrane protein n=1 Tax=Rhodococcus indonesiensis TaxID=3055869 RepID=A0ABT7RLS7_9NOCA|nr:TIGR02234 family membrane protein [Rhodococcus indonesiensis]MDM7488234.1 TIGR02234 family membrane protein [Rhodococcus indonesiensis]